LHSNNEQGHIVMLWRGAGECVYLIQDALDHVSRAARLAETHRLEQPLFSELFFRLVHGFRNSVGKAD